MATVPAGWGDPDVVPSLIANHIITTAQDYAAAQKLPAITVTTDDLTSAISEITPETQIIGAALLQVTFADPTSKIYRSGLCSQDSDGLLYQVDVNFPEGTPVWWRLAMVDYQSIDSSNGSPNLTLTFQHRIVNYLSDCWGPLGWPAGQVGQTRAQFLKMLVNKMPGELPKQSIGPGAAPADLSFICPEINELQPVSNAAGTGIISSAGGDNTVTTSGGSNTPVLGGPTAKKLSDKINKQPAVTAGSKITVKGSIPNSTQLHCINLVLDVGAASNAPTIAMEAAVFDLMLESDCGIACGWDAENATYGGCLGGNIAYFGKYGSSTSDAVWTAQATQFFNGGEGYAAGGAISAAKSNYNGFATTTSIAVLGSQVTAPTPFNSQGISSQYLGEDGYAQALSEAPQIVAAFSGGNLPAGSGTSSSTTGGGSGKSDIAQLTRGQSDDPDEDSWTCMQRLAQEVNWSLFTSPSPAPGVFGNYIYYSDQPTIAASKPALYLALSEDGTTWSATDPDTGKTVAAQGVVNTLSATTDNTAMQQQVTRTVKGKIRRARVIQTPQTPTQIMFNMIAGWLEFNAGDVFVFHDAGGVNGRWIVEDVTCNMLGDLFAQFTLGPPTYPYPEPQAVTTSASSKSGGLNGQTITAGSLDVSGYTNPLAKISNLVPERIDQGVDYDGSGPLLALGNGVVTGDSGAGWPGNGGVIYKLSDGPYAGKLVYYFENLIAKVSVGDKITAGQQVATMTGAIEVGWASGNGTEALAAALGQNALETGQGTDPGDCQSACGRNFNALLVALGAVSGGPGSGPISTGPGMPSNWPTLTASDVKKAQKNQITVPGLKLPSTSGPSTGIATGSSGVVTRVSGGFSGLF
jgi:hypothetical protein